MPFNDKFPVAESTLDGKFSVIDPTVHQFLFRIVIIFLAAETILKAIR